MKSRLITIDPGFTEVGVAVWDPVAKKLLECFAVNAPTVKDATRVGQLQVTAEHVLRLLGGKENVAGDTMVVEGMETRDGWEAAHGNLFELTLLAGLLGAHAEAFHVLSSHKWTRGRPKHVRNEQIEEILSFAETGVLLEALEAEGSEKRHLEIYDAIGLGLYWQRRMR